MKLLIRVSPPTKGDIAVRVTCLNASDAGKASLRERFERMFSDSGVYENDSLSSDGCAQRLPGHGAFGLLLQG